MCCICCCIKDMLEGTSGCPCSCVKNYHWIDANRSLIKSILQNDVFRDGEICDESLISLTSALRQRKVYDGAVNVIDAIRAHSPVNQLNLDIEPQVAWLDWQISREAKDKDEKIQEKFNYYASISEMTFVRHRNLQNIKRITVPAMQAAEQGIPDAQAAEQSLLPDMGKIRLEAAPQARVIGVAADERAMSVGEAGFHRGEPAMAENLNTELIGVLRDLKDEIRNLNEDVKSLSRSSRSK